MHHFSELPDQSGVAHASIQRIDGAAARSVDDTLAIEEPLEIRLEYGPRNQRVSQSISITMRTPGYDFELAAGFLFTEGIIRDGKDIEGIHYCGPEVRDTTFTNTVRVDLAPTVAIDMGRLKRHFYTSSSCGVCGKSSIEALRTQSRFTSENADLKVAAELIHQLPERLRKSQGIFESTGGLHASALFSATGDLILLREDVGRHNALDKIIGHAVLKNMLPLSHFLLLVSGRASFELIQKASMAGLGIFAAVGAPSSLAVELAKDTHMTLLGFVRNDRFNIYANGSRVVL
jgi:FdhD protein